MKAKSKKNGNFPNLRFPGFTEEWGKYKLGEISKLITDKMSSVRLSPYNYISTENIRQDFQGINIASSIPLDMNVTSFKIDDILLSNIRPYLKKVWKANINGGCSTDVLVFRNRKTCLSDFLYYSIANEYFINYVMLGVKGVKMPRGDKQQIIKYPVYLPSKTEQQKISEFLLLLDQRILTQIKIIEECESYMHGIRKLIFTQQLRFKDENGDYFPEWKEEKLMNIAEITTGSSNREDSVLNGKYLFFDRSQDIRTSSRYLFDKEAIIVPGEGQEFSPKYFVGKFDLHQRTYAIFDFKRINGKFLFYQIYNNNRHLQSMAVGSTVKSLRLPMFQQMPIKLPDLKEQIKIAELFSSFEEKIENERKILIQYQNQKKYFLQKMFI